MRVALLTVLLGTALSAGPQKPDLLLKVDKQTAFFPAPVEVQVRVWPTQESRLIDVSTAFTSTRWTIERQPGQEIRAERRTFTWRVPEPGQYLIVLTVLDHQHRVQAQKSIPITRIYNEQ